MLTCNSTVSSPASVAADVSTAVDVALGDGDLRPIRRMTIAPGILRPEPLAHGGDIDAHALEVLGELVLGHLVAVGQALQDALDLVVGDLDAELLGLLQLQALLDQLFLGSFLSLGRTPALRAIDRLLLQGHGKLLLALLEER